MQDRLQELREELEKARELKKDLEDKISFIDLIISIGEFNAGLERVAQLARDTVVEQKHNQEEIIIDTVINSDTSKEQYKIVTQSDFIGYKLSKLSAVQITKNTVNNLKRSWDKMSCGFNFMIAVGKEELMFYSPQYFSKNILGD